ncbi:unnamed protein product [Sympodiomycopsis kandeliae]
MVPHTHFPAGSAHHHDRRSIYADQHSSSSQHPSMHNRPLHPSSSIYRPLSPPLHQHHHQQHHHQHKLNHDQHTQHHRRSSSSSSYAPPEPTPPDSGRSKTIREHDLNLLVRQKERGHHHDRQVQDSNSPRRASSSPSSTEYLQNGYMDENDVPLDHPDQYEGDQQEQERQRHDDDDDDTPMGRPQLLDWQSDEDDQYHSHHQHQHPRSRLHGHKQSHYHHPSGRHQQQGHALSRQSSGMERSASGSSAGSSSGFSSPHHRQSTTWSSNNDHGGYQGMQIPIRDTPNNPFLGSTDNDINNCGLFDPRRRRTGRGEDAARAQRKGYVTCVFRGQRILQLDVASDDSEEEDLFLAPTGAPRGRLQPKLLFPEAHAQEQRRARQRQQDEQERLRQQQQQQRFANGRPSNFGHYSSRHGMMSSSISMPSHMSMQAASSSCSSSSSSSRRSSRGPIQATTSGNLFASHIRQRELDREHELQRSREERSRDLHRREFLRSKSSRQIADLMDSEHHHQPTQSRADPRLLATLARAGWDSGDDDDDDENADRTARDVYDDRDSPYAMESPDIVHSHVDDVNDPYVGYHYRPPVPEDYDEPVTRGHAKTTRMSEEDAFWMGRETDRSNQTSTTRPKRAMPARRQTMAPTVTRYADDGEDAHHESTFRRLAPIRSQSSTQLYHGEEQASHRATFQRPSFTARVSINSMNKRAWDGAFREPAVHSSSGEDEFKAHSEAHKESSTDSDDPFNSRPTAAPARKGRTSMHNGLPICGLPSRSMSSQNLAMSRSNSSTALPTASSQQSDNPFDLDFLASVQERE